MQMMVPNRMLIIEGQALFAKALAQMLILDSSIVVVGDADSITEAYVRSTWPDLILIDIDNSSIDLTEAVQASRNVSPNVKICTLSMHLQPDVLQHCFNAGADGYIVKKITPNEFLHAIKSFMSGETYADPRIAGRLLRRRSSRAGYPDPCDLSGERSKLFG